MQLAPEIVSVPRSRSGGTFSNMPQGGRSSVHTRCISRHNLLRSPSRTLRRGEAPLTSWHGLRPEMMSTLHRILAPALGAPLCLFASGKCLPRIALQNSDFSTCHTVRIEEHWKPRSKPPIPLNREPWVDFRGRLLSSFVILLHCHRSPRARSARPIGIRARLPSLIKLPSAHRS